MGPDPFNMPGASSAGIQEQLTNSYNQLAPYAPTWHGALTGPTVQQIQPQPSSSSSGGVLSKFEHFIGGVGTEIGHIAGGAATWLGRNAAQFATAVPKFLGNDVGHEITDAFSVKSLNAQADQSSKELQSLNNQFKDGLINSNQYKQGLKVINQNNRNLQSQSNALNKSIAGNIQTSKIDAINAAAAVLTVASGGSGAPETVAAAKLLDSAVTDEALNSVSANIGKVAANKVLFDGLSDGAKQAIQDSTAEVIANSGKVSSAKLARNAAINLAIKYPVYYNYLSTTGSQIYNELDNAKYGDAIRTTAFNAALLLSGGPIGQAVKYGGKFASEAGSKIFSRSTFLDELSKGIGDGDPAGLFNSIMRLPETERADVIKQMSAVEATNVNAVGKDPYAAAQRVLNGMQSYEGISMQQFTHDEALQNMVNFARAQRIADEAGRARGLGPITVGRVDARALNEISAKLSPAQDRLGAWEEMKADNPTQAWANNDNFDRQIKNLIEKYPDSAELDNAIRNIKAAFNVEGFPVSTAKQLSKMGYIPIKPSNLEAPFKEGTGKVATAFSDSNEFFTKAVQPLPVFDSLGAALTKVGLSPYASQQRVYQLFNENLSRNLQDANLVKKITGEDAQTTTDTMIKQLSSYAHNPQGALKRLPITDLRMLTTKDIQRALEVSGEDARGIQKAIAQAHTQIPVALRGLGESAVDALYRAPVTGALQRKYLRIITAGRFSWNPFFQYLRVIPKTEILSEFEGGGFVSSIFRGQLGQLSSIQRALRDAGALDERGKLGDVVSGEAVSYAGAMDKNLGHKLLPAQEKSIAGLVAAQADRMGMSWQDYIKTFPDNVRDTVQMIAGYDRHSNILNSPLMRTLNIAFFPLRFETKVASIMVRSLARTSPMTQVAVVNGLLRAHQFFNSAEGQAWYLQNQQLISLFDYITPAAELNQVFEALVPGHNHALGNFGELGGLPFGFIPQLLDSEGLTHFNQPGISPATGAIYAQYMPQNSRGQVAVAVQDLLTQLFSYPGATVGLLPKATLTGNAASFLTTGTLTGSIASGDIKRVIPSSATLTPQQQQFQQTAQSLSNTNIKQATVTPQPLRPALSVPVTAQRPAPSPVASGRSSKKKKSQFTPELLPGQSQLGQL